MVSVIFAYLQIVCPGSVKTFQAISLSRNTVVERVTDMARNLNDQIKEKSSCFEAFSIACDESTDIGGVAQLAVFFFFRACDTDFNIFEELLELSTDAWHYYRRRYI
ncbi:hypothetical protein LAZ67_18001543 [Cordylochernes scorpioides]|uniref:Uncharacterized protein n=1 Tax=Cordylochernes scorpioides TaxID=51811 RepID=A0ABY6LIF3_9ARAC|nr:hypothetical protein LAZ67_18001543 [Cordylochernes scorpioides]